MAKKSTAIAKIAQAEPEPTFDEKAYRDDAQVKFEERLAALNDNLDKIARGADIVNRSLIAALMAAKDIETVSNYTRLFRVTRDLDDLFDETAKSIGKVVDEIALGYLPRTFELEKCKTFTGENGDRVSLTLQVLASIPGGQRPAAYAWLRKHDKADLITETVNASTLSSFAKTWAEQWVESQGQEGGFLPEELFTVLVRDKATLTRGKQKK